MANTWADFVQFVAHSCVGCSSMTISTHLQAAMDEFCSATSIWVETLDPIGLMAGQDTYDIPVDANTRVIGIESVMYNGFPLKPMTSRALTGFFPTWEVWDDGINQIMAYRVEMDDTDQNLTVWPSPTDNEPASVVMRVTLKPTSTATSIPGFIYEDWRTVIGSGALAQILLIPGKDFTNPQLAQVHDAKFRTGKSRAKVRALGQQAGGTLTMRPRRFGE